MAPLWSPGTLAVLSECEAQQPLNKAMLSTAIWCVCVCVCMCVCVCVCGHSYATLLSHILYYKYMYDIYPGFSDNFV